MIEHRSPISGVATHAGLVATAGYDGQVIVWDVRHKAALSRVRHDHLANQCAFSRCGRYLVTASSDYTARLWRLPDLALLAVMQHDDDVERAVLDPGSTMIATASCDKRIRVFDLAGKLLHTFQGHSTDQVWTDFTRDGRFLISASDDGDIRYWDPVGGQMISRIALSGYQVDAFVEGPAGILYAGDDAGKITALKGEKLWSIAAHRSGIKCLAYDETTGCLLSTAYDGCLRSWRVGADGGLEAEVTSAGPPLFWPRSCALTAARQAVVSTFGSTYATYDLASGTWDLAGVRPTQGLNYVGFSGSHLWSCGDAGAVTRDAEVVAQLGELLNFVLPVGGQVLAAGQSGRIFDVLTGRVLYEHGSPLNCALVCPGDASRFLVGAYSGEVLRFQVGDGQLRLASIVAPSDSAIKSLATDGETVVAVGADLSLMFLSPDSLSVINTIPNAHDLVLNGAVALAAGVYATVGRDRMLRIWTRGDPRVFPTPHDHSVRCVAFCSRANAIATGAYDGKIAILEVNRGRWSRVLRPTDFGISAVCSTDRPGVFVASSYDGLLHEVSL